MNQGHRIPGIDSVAVADVTVAHRLRPVSEAGVAALIESVRQLGAITDAIHVRRLRHRDNALVLMAGAHRLEAARRLGWETIPAAVWEGNDAWAALMEVDDNLAGAELTPLDTAVFLAARKRIYEQEHPEARAGGDRKSLEYRLNQTDILSFCSATAEKFGLTDRHVRRLVAAGEALAPDEVARLRAAPRPVRLADLQTIAKVSAPDRYRIVDALSEGRARNAAAALRVADAAPDSAHDAALKALLKAWDRAPASARRAFAEERGAQVARLAGGDR